MLNGQRSHHIALELVGQHVQEEDAFPIILFGIRLNFWRKAAMEHLRKHQQMNRLLNRTLQPRHIMRQISLFVIGFYVRLNQSYRNHPIRL